jgi:hypothetical protein
VLRRPQERNFPRVIVTEADLAHGAFGYEIGDTPTTTSHHHSRTQKGADAGSEKK